MADAPVAANAPAAAAGGAPAQTQQSMISSLLGTVMRMVAMYLVFNTFFGSKNSEVAKPTAVGTSPRLGGEKANAAAVWENLYRFKDPLLLRVYVSENEFGLEEKDLVWEESGIVYGDWSAKSFSYSFTPSQNVLNNGSIFAHITLTNMAPRIQSRDLYTITKTKPLNRYLPKKKVVAKKNLITGENSVPLPEESQESDPKKVEIISYWYTNVTLSLVTDASRLQASSTPPQLKEVLELDETGKYYYPYLYLNDFWLLKEDLFPLNDTIQTLDLHLHFEPLSLFMWQMMSQFDKSLESQASMGLTDGGNPDEFKRMLRDTNPFLLGLTFFVTLLHSVFDFLAFRNDINFWKNKKSMEGLSLRTIFVNIFFQAVIFLYLLDNETSFVVLISSGIGLLIEAWKISKAMIVAVDSKGKFPFITFKEKKTYKKKTKEYDALAFRYLSWIAYPLLAAYSVYSLIYNEHKSWYSFVLNTLVGFVYTFGFIMMTPQLFINYKLKSVAHMPWKTFMYKALNTFIDDLFAFIIKMPLLHRLACLRDDLIFFVYLYQRWIYPVDNKRANEFGQVGEEGGEDDEELVEEIEGEEKPKQVDAKEEKKEEEKEEEVEAGAKEAKDQAEAPEGLHKRRAQKEEPEDVPEAATPEEKKDK